MKYTKSLSIVALLSASSAWAATSPYYEYEILSPDTDGSNYGPYGSAISDDSELIGVYATKAKVDQNLDVGVPYTFNQTCFFDDDICTIRYSGSENSSDLSFENAYQAWRTASAEADQGILDPVSYFMGATNNVNIEGFGEDTDVAITDVVDIDGESFAVGYGSAPYDSAGERDFVRRGFITDSSTSEATISLLPDYYGDDDEGVEGGFTSAYRMRQVTYTDGTVKTLIIGSSSKSLAGGDSDYFDACYNEGDEDEESTLNNLVYCPGFDTQAWAWEYDSSSSATELEGFALATEWLDDNSTRAGSDATYSAAAFDINSSGVAVGVSSFERSDSAQGARQRAIIMTPSSDGTYSEPTELTKATSGVSDQDDNIYNTWAKTITDENIVMGNRQYAATKNRNKPIEMFIYDIDEDSVTFPLEDTKVQSTKQRLAGDSASFNGANSEGYAMNENGLIVGKADAFDEEDPVVDGIYRTQSAFLYDNTSGDSWFIEDLLCTEDEDGVVTHPLIRLQSATAINDDGVVLAEGFQYSSISNYQNQVDATAILVKLTPNTSSTPDDSPNCWESEALETDDSSGSSGGASFWLWLLALPVLLVRRLKVTNN